LFGNTPACQTKSRLDSCRPPCADATLDLPQIDYMSARSWRNRSRGCIEARVGICP